MRSTLSRSPPGGGDDVDVLDAITGESPVPTAIHRKPPSITARRPDEFENVSRFALPAISRAAYILIQGRLHTRPRIEDREIPWRRLPAPPASACDHARRGGSHRVLRTFG